MTTVAPASPSRISVKRVTRRRSGERHRPATAPGRIVAAAQNWPDALEAPLSSRRRQLLAFGLCTVVGWMALIGTAASTLG